MFSNFFGAYMAETYRLSVLLHCAVVRFFAQHALRRWHHRRSGSVRPVGLKCCGPTRQSASQPVSLSVCLLAPQSVAPEAEREQRKDKTPEMEGGVMRLLL